MKQTDEDRRKMPRIEDQVCTWLSFGSDAAAYATMSVDISPEGASFCTGHTIRMGDKIRLTMQLDPQDVELTGEVCWARRRPDGSSSFGVRFVQREPALLSKLEDHLGSRIST